MKGVSESGGGAIHDIQMLNFFGYPEWESRILSCMEQLLSEGRHLTPDLKGSASTSGCADALIRLIIEKKAQR